MSPKARPSQTAGTPAILAAEKAGIAFSVLEYAHDADAASYGLEAAEALGVSPASVFKTLVANVDGNRLLIAVIPVDARLSLKALATAARGKRAEVAEPAAAERATGYVVGGISPLGQRRSLPIFIDQSALDQPTMHISAGRRGLELALAPADLIRLAVATVAPLTA
jgi:Cys-tRNA(Pro)/Cys-tRNA(Cys) deacylase